MREGDLVKFTKYARFQLEHASKLCGIVTKVIGAPQAIVYVAWADRRRPMPVNVRWLEKINEKTVSADIKQ